MPSNLHYTRPEMEETLPSTMHDTEGSEGPDPNTTGRHLEGGPSNGGPPTPNWTAGATPDQTTTEGCAPDGPAVTNQ